MMKYFFYSLVVAVGLFFPVTQPVYAQVCYPQRVINQHRCQGGDPILDCTGGYRSEQIGTTCWDTGYDEINAQENCVAKCEGVYPGRCAEGYCVSWGENATTCAVEDKFVGCTAPPDCKAVTEVVSCSYVGETCVDTTQTLVYGCWGPGPTATPGGPTPTPGLCGNLLCDTGEDCVSCPTDCVCGGGLTPTPTPGGSCVEGGPLYSGWSTCSGSPATKSRQVTYNCQPDQIETVNCTGTIRARAHQVSTTSPTCADIAAGNAGSMNGSTFQFTSGSASNPSPQTQNGVNYVTFSSIVGGSYTLVPQAPSGSTLVYAGACWTRVSPASNGTGLSGTLSVPDDGDTLTWDLGYGPPGPWVQTVGGNVMVGGNLTSRLPVFPTPPPRAFNLDGSGGFPGLVTYGTTYDLDIDPCPTCKGSGLVSSTNWLAQDTVSSTNWYEYFKNRFGLLNATTNDNALFPDLGNLRDQDVPSRGKPYFIQGDVTTSGTWSVGDTESIIVVVDGALTINGNITIAGNGFIAFIVKGNISISPTVGVPASSSTSVLDGIYVAGNTFQTGVSTNPGTERLVGTGTFIANSFTLQRDLDSVGANETTAAELFVYNPRLFLNLPDSMKEHAVTWQEVAP